MPPLELQEILDRLTEQSLNADVYYVHLHLDTLQQYYSSLLNQVAIDLMLLPPRRFEAKLPAFGDDSSDVHECVTKLTRILANMFDKPHKQVEHEMILAVGQPLIGDLKQSMFLKSEGKLH